MEMSALKAPQSSSMANPLVLEHLIRCLDYGCFAKCLESHLREFEFILVTWVVFKCNATIVILHSHKWKSEKIQAKCGKVTWERRRQETRLLSRQSGLGLPTNSTYTNSPTLKRDKMFRLWLPGKVFIRGYNKSQLSTSQPTRATNSPRVGGRPNHDSQYIRTGKKRILFSASQPTRPGTNSPRGSSVAYFIHFWRTIK